MQVPVLWKPVKHRAKHYRGFQREWVVSETMGSAGDRSGPDSRNAPGRWSPLSASRPPWLSFREKPGFLRPAALRPARWKVYFGLRRGEGQGYQALVCYVVGTPLQFSYLGSKTYEPAARRMLASLN